MLLRIIIIVSWWQKTVFDVLPVLEKYFTKFQSGLSWETIYAIGMFKLIFIDEAGFFDAIFLITKWVFVDILR